MLICQAFFESVVFLACFSHCVLSYEDHRKVLLIQLEQTIVVLPWTSSSPSGYCECDINELNGLLRCKESTLSVLDCYCVTYDDTTQEFIVGTCMLNFLGYKSHMYD